MRRDKMRRVRDNKMKDHHIHFFAQEASGDRLVVADAAPVEVDDWATARPKRAVRAMMLSFMVTIL